MIGMISALSHSNYFICLVTYCLWILKHKHHSQFGNVLCWHSPKAPVLCKSTRKYHFSFLLRRLPEFFIFHFCVAPKASCCSLGFILPLTLCSVQLRQHPDGLFLKWALSGKSLTVVTHQRMKLAWKDCAKQRGYFSFQCHLGVIQL